MTQYINTITGALADKATKLWGEANSAARDAERYAEKLLRTKGSEVYFAQDKINRAAMADECQLFAACAERAVKDLTAVEAATRALEDFEPYATEEADATQDMVAAHDSIERELVAARKFAAAARAAANKVKEERGK